MDAAKAALMGKRPLSCLSCGQDILRISEKIKQSLALDRADGTGSAAEWGVAMVTLPGGTGRDRLFQKITVHLSYSDGRRL
jgi:hypothetical protein